MDPVFFIIPAIWIAAAAVIILFFRGASKLERVEARHWAGRAGVPSTDSSEERAAA